MSAKQTKHNMTAILESIKQQMNKDPIDNSTNQKSISTHLCCTQKALSQAKSETDTLQKKHLEAVLNDARAANQQKKTKVLTHLIHAEQLCCILATHQIQIIGQTCLPKDYQ